MSWPPTPTKHIHRGVRPGGRETGAARAAAGGSALLALGGGDGDGGCAKKGKKAMAECNYSFCGEFCSHRLKMLQIRFFSRNARLRPGVDQVDLA